ncbi:MAG: TetR/AcrR family transcriptional regulator [Ectothiorhodospiraceae bacterium]|nr:TetR/AcrR family transcriptional regulator [Ectothiorhodospiraceae bacterium]
MARQRKHNTEEMINMALVAAENLIIGGGLSQLSGRKVSAEIGYSVGSLYTVFENLDDLILQVNGRTLDAMRDAMLSALEGCETPEKCIKAMAYAYVEYACLNNGLWTAVYEHNLPKDTALPGWFAEKVDGMFLLVEMQLSSLQGLSQNKISEVAKTLWCGVHGICVLAATRKYEAANVAHVNPLVDGLITNYMAGIQLEIRGEKV